MSDHALLKELLELRVGGLVNHEGERATDHAVRVNAQRPHKRPKALLTSGGVVIEVLLKTTLHLVETDKQGEGLAAHRRARASLLLLKELSEAQKHAVLLIFIGLKPHRADGL